MTCATCGIVDPEFGFHSKRKNLCLLCGRKAHAEYMAAYKAKNPDAFNAKRRARHKANPETNRKALREWMKKNPGYNSRKCKEWKEANPEVSRASKSANYANRKAKRKSSPGKFTAKQFRELCAKYEHRCLCCGEKKPLTPDHVVPFCQGGANGIENIQPLCYECNVKKHMQTIDYRPKGKTMFPSIIIEPLKSWLRQAKVSQVPVLILTGEMATGKTVLADFIALKVGKEASFICRTVTIESRSVSHVAYSAKEHGYLYFDDYSFQVLPEVPGRSFCVAMALLEEQKNIEFLRVPFIVTTKEEVPPEFERRALILKLPILEHAHLYEKVMEWLEAEFAE